MIRYLFPAAVGLACLPSISRAAVIGQWRFEQGAFLTDSGPNGYTLGTPGGTSVPTQVPPPSGFPNSIPGLGANTGAASFDGDDRFTASIPSMPSTTLSIEAIVTTSVGAVSSGGVTKAIAGQWSGSGSDRVALLAILSTNVLNFYFNGTNVGSGLPALVANQTYYVAVTVNMANTSSAGITFYQQNLSAAGPLLTAGVAHSATHTAFNTSSVPFTIGATNTPSSTWNGVIDEVKFSDTKLALSELIIPEPSSLALAFAGAGLAVLRRRR